MNDTGIDEVKIILYRAAYDAYKIIKTYPINKDEDPERYLERVMSEKTFSINPDNTRNKITFAHRLALITFLDVTSDSTSLKESTFYSYMNLIARAINLADKNIRDGIIDDWARAHKE